MKKARVVIILLNLIIVIIYINWTIAQKEKTLEYGVLALFELAPVDPRSLMQGDYMDLRYAIAREDWKEEKAKRGYCIFKLNENKVAQKVRLQSEVNPLESGEYAVKYFMNGRRMRFGAESYFFEEGTGQRYEKADYGGLRIDDAGNSVLVDLYDEQFQVIN